MPNGGPCMNGNPALQQGEMWKSELVRHRVYYVGATTGERGSLSRPAPSATPATVGQEILEGLSIDHHFLQN